MFSEAFVGSSSRLTPCSRFWAFALVVAGILGPEPLYAQDGMPQSHALQVSHEGVISTSNITINIPEGGTATYQVVPIGDPGSGNVTVTVSIGDATVATIPALSSSLTFTSLLAPQEVTVRAVGNEGQSTMITHTASANGRPHDGLTATVTIIVIDDEVDTSDPLTPLNFYVPEDLLPSFEATAMIADLVAEVRQPIVSQRLPKATGGDTPLTYSLAGNLPEGLVFHANTRWLQGTPTAETDSAETMIYRVRDADFDADTLMFTITVTPPDLKPTFGDATIADLVAEVNQEVLWSLPQATGGDGPLRYSLLNLPDGLVFNPVQQQLQGAATATDTAIVSFRATDVDGDQAILPFAVTIIPANRKPTFGDATIADLVAEVGEAIEPVDLPSASGGDYPLRYSLSNLPAGLAFHANTRQLRGAATAADTTVATYTVTDADGDEATLTFTIAVIDADLMPTFGDATIAPLTATACQPIAQSLPAAVGGDEPLTYSLSNLPAGLVFHPDTRQLQGIPTALADEGQTSTIQGTYTATDADGDAASLPFTLTVHTGLDAPDWVRAENYLGADSTSTWGGFVLLTWALPSQHAFVDAYRIYRELWITHSTDEHGQLVELDEPRDEFVPWARADAVPGVSVGRAVVTTLDYRATRWAVAAECGRQRTSLRVADDRAKLVPPARDRRAVLLAQPVVQSAMTATEGRVGAIASSTPAAFALGPNYPNPFNPATTIQYALPHAAEVQLTIHNALGQVLHTLVAEYQPAGHYAVHYDGRDLSAGIYFYRLQAGPVSLVEKMVLLK